MCGGRSYIHNGSSTVLTVSLNLNNRICLSESKSWIWVKCFRVNITKKSDQASALKWPNRNFVLLSLLCSIKLT